MKYKWKVVTYFKGKEVSCSKFRFKWMAETWCMMLQPAYMFTVHMWVGVEPLR